ncbi:MAG: hypothetical protein JXB08_00395 [Bacilli bacterium]|nr:hypothetical protein [Bacilli bacterium]MBN2877980.1 hypothetical protein [Bacilli bacterium]
MKRILTTALLVFLSFVFIACETTTISTTQATSNYVPVTNIDIEADIYEPCQGTIISFTVTVYPSNATNQNYTITINPTYMLSFVSGSNSMQVEVVAEGTSGEITENMVTVTSSDNTSITDTLKIYVYPASSTSPSCQVN